MIVTNLENSNDNLFEAVNSMVRRGLASKRAALAGKSAMAIARAKNPALYNRYMKLNLMRKTLKAKINKQYGAMAKAAARKHRF